MAEEDQFAHRHSELDIAERVYLIGERIEAVTAATHSVIDMLDKYIHASLASFERIDDQIKLLNERQGVLSARVSGIDAKGVLLEERRKRKSGA